MAQSDLKLFASVCVCVRPGHWSMSPVVKLALHQFLHLQTSAAAEEEGKTTAEDSRWAAVLTSSYCIYVRLSVRLCQKYIFHFFALRVLAHPSKWKFCHLVLIFISFQTCWLSSFIKQKRRNFKYLLLFRSHFSMQLQWIGTESFQGPKGIQNYHKDIKASQKQSIWVF